MEPFSWIWNGVGEKLEKANFLLGRVTFLQHILGKCWTLNFKKRVPMVIEGECLCRERCGIFAKWKMRPLLISLTLFDQRWFASSRYYVERAEGQIQARWVGVRYGFRFPGSGSFFQLERTSPSCLIHFFGRAVQRPLSHFHSKSTLPT
jgi:hypothetical protein